jgi:dimethylhistidine N-methyltransferase
MTTLSTDRFTLIETEFQVALDTFAHEVAQGLCAAPKTLPCRHFYDRRGSELFEAICQLPEYYLTRAESEILTVHAPEIAALFDEPVALVELGSGSAVKTQLLIEALLEHQRELLFAPIDISQSALEESARELLDRYEDLEVIGVAAPYEVGLAHLQREIAGPRLALWLGSSVGNFETDAAVSFLGEVADALDRESDRLLIGMDLHKDRAVLERAYDDTQGITAAFNLNLLGRINRELGGHFDLDRFAHRAVYDEALGRVEMHLVSRDVQTIAIDDLEQEIAFAAGETIHSENSHKYRLEDIPKLLAEAGFELERQFFDRQRRFSLNLARPRR